MITIWNSVVLAHKFRYNKSWCCYFELNFCLTGYGWDIGVAKSSHNAIAIDFFFLRIACVVVVFVFGSWFFHRHHQQWSLYIWLAIAHTRACACVSGDGLCETNFMTNIYRNGWCCAVFTDIRTYYMKCDANAVVAVAARKVYSTTESILEVLYWGLTRIWIWIKTTFFSAVYCASIASAYNFFLAFQFYESILLPYKTVARLIHSRFFKSQNIYIKKDTTHSTAKEEEGAENTYMNKQIPIKYIATLRQQQKSNT